MKLLGSDAWELGGCLATALVVSLVAVVFHSVAGLSIEVSIVLGFAVSFALVIGWFFVATRKGMQWSPEGDAALQRAMEELRAELAAENQPISRVEGSWGHQGYPSVNLLFTSGDALREAQLTGLLERIASKIGETVKRDAAFGRYRESFDQQKGIFFYSNSDPFTYAVHDPAHPGQYEVKSHPVKHPEG